MLSRLLDTCLFLVYWCFKGTLVLGWVLCCLPSYFVGSIIVSCVILMLHIHCLMHLLMASIFFYFFNFWSYLCLAIFQDRKEKKKSAVALARHSWFFPTCCLDELLYFKLQRCLGVLGGLQMFGKMVKSTFYCGRGKYWQMKNLTTYLWLNLCMDVLFDSAPLWSYCLVF